MAPPSLESVLRTILGRAPAGVPQGALPSQGPNASDVCVEVTGSDPADRVCGLPPTAPGAGVMTPGVSLFIPLEAPEGVSPVDQALSQAARAQQSNDRAQFAYWSQRAVAEARRIPNGDVIAVPMVEADLMAIDGNFIGASQRYRALEASLAVAARRDPSLQSAIDAVKQRHKGVLAAGVAMGSVRYAQSRAAMDSVGMLQAQRLATVCADEIYRLEPTERNLQLTLATYAQVGLDLRELRRQVALNEAQIQNIETGQVAPALAQGNPPQPSPASGSDPFGLNQPPDPSMTVEQLRAYNTWANGVIARTEAHVYRMVGAAQADSPYQAAIQRSTALAMMGNGHDALVELRQARTLFTSGRVPRTPENLATEITVLHRLVGVSGIDYDYHQEVLTEARGLITTFNAADHNQAVLFTIENMEMTGTLRANRMAGGISNPDLSDDDKDAAVRDYQTAMREGQMDIVRYCETSLRGVTDPAARAAIGDRMFSSRAVVLEQDLGAALVRYQKDERAESRVDADAAIHEFQTFAAAHRDIPSDTGYREAMGRATLAQAHFDFRTGRIEESITALRSVKDDYFDSGASRIVTSQGGWPHQYNIVDGHGEFRADLGQPDVIAGIKTFAAQLTREQGRGMVACGAGMAALGIYAAADIALGEKVSGIAASQVVIYGCVGGFLVDRAVLEIQSSNEISAAYRAGVSNITTEQAVFSGGMFALNLASMYVGGAVGGLAEKASVAGLARAGLVRFVETEGGTQMTASLTPFLASRGLVGPWARVAGDIAGEMILRGPKVPNGIAFHYVSSRTNYAGMTAWSSAFGREGPRAPRDTAQDYLVSILFVGAVAEVMRANPAGKVITGEGRMDQWARTGINTGIGLGAVQGVHALASRDSSQISLDRLGSMGMDFLLTHHGNRVMESVLPMAAVQRWSAGLDAITRRNMEQARTAIENAPPPGNWFDGGFGGMQPAFAFAGGGRGGGAAALGGPELARPFELPRPGQGFGPFMMMSSADEATNPDIRPARGGGLPSDFREEPTNPGGESRPPREVTIARPFDLPMMIGTPATDHPFDGNDSIRANAILEYYSHPDAMTSLDRFLSDRGPWGDAAETLQAHIVRLRLLVPEYRSLESQQAADPSPLRQAELQQTGRDILRVMNLIERSSYNRMETAWHSRGLQLNGEMIPLETALTSLYVDARTESARTGGQPDIVYRVSDVRPDVMSPSVNMDFASPENSFARVGAGDMFRYDVTVSSPMAGRRLVEKLQHDHLLASGATLGDGNTTLHLEVPYSRLVDGRMVISRHRVDLFVHVQTPASAAPVLRSVDMAARGYEYAWNTDTLWTGGSVPLMDATRGSVQTVVIYDTLAATRGDFRALQDAVTSRSPQGDTPGRVGTILQTLQHVHDGYGSGDPQRRVIESLVSELRGAVGSSSSDSILPLFWVRTSQVLTRLATENGARPAATRNHAFDGLGVHKEQGIATAPRPAAGAGLHYQWAPADAARVAP